MNQQALYQATVPVFRHYTARIDAIVSGLDADGRAMLAKSLVPDTFTAGEHLAVSQGFALRTVYPLIGAAVPELSTEATDADGLRQRCIDVMDRLAAVTPDDFSGADRRRITHVAGDAALEQPATDFVTLYALPNFFFYLTMGYATLRHGGVDLGKADFDAHHAYPPGFRFT